MSFRVRAVAPSDDRRAASSSSDRAADACEAAIDIIRRQPPDASFDDVLRALAFHRVVEKGLSDAEAGRVMSHETFRRKLQSWLG